MGPVAAQLLKDESDIMPLTRTVELRAIYAFDCDDCGRENIVRPVAAELSERDRVELAEQGQTDLAEGEWITMPTQVRCSACGAVFKPVDPE